MKFIDLDADRKLAVAAMTRALGIAAMALAETSDLSTDEWALAITMEAKEQVEKLSPVQLDEIMRQIDAAEDAKQAIAIVVEPQS